MRSAPVGPAAVGLGPPRTPPPWSPAIGPLRVLTEQLDTQRQLGRVIGCWLVAAVLALAIRQPWALLLLVVPVCAGLLLGRVLPQDGLPGRGIRLAHPAPVDAPRRRRAGWWPYAVGSAAALPLLALLVFAAATNLTPVGWAPGGSSALMLATTFTMASRRGRKRLAAWERESGVQVLVPVVGWRSPARGGYYLTPAPPSPAASSSHRTPG